MSAPPPPPANHEHAVIRDYVYVDRARIASYHTQLLGLGLPVQSKYSESVTDSEGEQTGGSIKIFSGSMSSSVTRTGNTERTFDQAWPMIHQTLDELWKRGRIQTSVIGVPVGSLFLCSGVLSIVDLNLLQSIWTPLTRQMKKSTAKAASNADLGSMGDFVKAIAVPTVFQVYQPEEGSLDTSQGVTTWGVLRPENLLTAPDTFALMNGGILPGVHHVIGILDYGLKNAPDASKFLDSFTPSNTFEMLLVMQHAVRSMFGRSDYANGMTPLVIYRELANNVS